MSDNAHSLVVQALSMFSPYIYCVACSFVGDGGSYFTSVLSVRNVPESQGQSPDSEPNL